MGQLGQPVCSQRRTAHGVIVDPVHVDHPVEGSDDCAGIDVDHPHPGVLGGDAAPDEHPVAGGAEAGVDVPAGGDEVGDRSRPVEAPAGDDGFVDAEGDELGAVAGGPERPVVAVLGVEPAHGQAGGEVPFDEPAERITAVERVAGRDDGEVAAWLQLGVVPQHDLAGQIDAGQPDPAGRDDGPVAGGVEQRDGVVRRRDRRPQRGRLDVEQANGPVDRSDHVYVADGGDPRRGSGEVQGVAEVGGADVDVVRIGRSKSRARWRPRPRSVASSTSSAASSPIVTASRPPAVENVAASTRPSTKTGRNISERPAVSITPIVLVDVAPAPERVISATNVPSGDTARIGSGSLVSPTAGNGAPRSPESRSYGRRCPSGPARYADSPSGATMPAPPRSAANRWASRNPWSLVNVDSRADRVRGVSASRFASTASRAAVSRCVARRDSARPTSASTRAAVAASSARRRCATAITPASQGHDERGGDAHEQATEAAGGPAGRFHGGVAGGDTGVHELPFQRGDGAAGLLERLDDRLQA